jgi:hypothetical protein
LAPLLSRRLSCVRLKIARNLRAHSSSWSPLVVVRAEFRSIFRADSPDPLSHATANMQARDNVALSDRNHTQGRLA